MTVQFAPTRPITVEIEDGQLWVTLRVVRLNRGDRVDLTKFIVRAAYKPQIDGLQATLVRDGHLRISGPGMSMRERLPVRAIFNKVLSPNRPFPLTLPQLIQHPAMESLVVSQLELRDGWIGLAISEDDAPRIATGQTKRSTNSFSNRVLLHCTPNASSHRWACATGCGQLQTRKNNASRHQRPTGCPATNPAPLAAVIAACVVLNTNRFAAPRRSEAVAVSITRRSAKQQRLQLVNLPGQLACCVRVDLHAARPRRPGS